MVGLLSVGFQARIAPYLVAFLATGLKRATRVRAGRVDVTPKSLVAYHPKERAGLHETDGHAPTRFVARDGSVPVKYLTLFLDARLALYVK